MSEKPKRPFLQIHLPTAYALTIVSSTMIIGLHRYCIFIGRQSFEVVDRYIVIGVVVIPIVAPTVLFLTMTICEHLIRRREGRKP